MNQVYFEFEGKYYGIGTKVLLKTRYDGIQEATFESCNGNSMFIGEYHWTNHKYNPIQVIKIIEPVEVFIEQSLQQETFNKNNYSSAGIVDFAWIWYVAIMLIGSIFEARMLLWIFATLYFFWWKGRKN